MTPAPITRVEFDVVKDSSVFGNSDEKLIVGGAEEDCGTPWYAFTGCLCMLAVLVVCAVAPCLLFDCICTVGLWYLPLMESTGRWTLDG